MPKSNRKKSLSILANRRAYSGLFFKELGVEVKPISKSFTYLENN